MYCDPDEGTPGTEPWPDRCGNCGGAHHIQVCPEILDALPNPGRAIFRHFVYRRQHFIAMLHDLDRDIWPVLAAPVAAYRQMTTTQVLNIWTKAVDGTICLPASAAA